MFWLVLLLMVVELLCVFIAWLLWLVFSVFLGDVIDVCIDCWCLVIDFVLV